MKRSMLVKTLLAMATGKSGGGLYPTLEVTITNGTATSVTATLNSTVVNLTYDSAADVWRGTLKAFGTWTITATDGEKTVIDTVDVVNVAVYTASLSFSPLPSGYTELEYIQSTGSQYIDTGLSMPNGFRVITKIVPLSSSSSVYSYILAGESLINNTYGRNSFGFYDSRWSLMPGGFGYGSAYSPNTEYSVEASTLKNNTFLKVNNAIVPIDWRENDTGVRTSLNLFLCARHADRASPAVDFSSVKILESFAVYSTSDDSNLVAHYYPAKRDSDGLVGLYDVIRNRFDTSATTTAFIAGPEVTHLAA